MQSMTINEIIKAVKGTLIHKIEKENIQGISIDSRRMSQGDLYIPIKGETFDGHDFIDQAAKNGACAYFTEYGDRINDKANVILVKSTIKALQDLALFYRKKFDIPFVAITGSSGKTTTKDMVASVIEQKYNPLKTQGNYNNEIGLPLTLFQLESHHDLAIIEMGMSDFGEISTLVNMVHPDIAVITNIGLTHIENLKSQQGIFEAKKEILETLKEGQIAILNGDDEYLKRINSNHFKTLFFGINGHELDLRAQDNVREEDSISFQVEDKDGHIEAFTINLPGVHNIYNSLIAIAIGRYYGLSQKEIQVGLDQFRPSKMRMDISEIGQVKIINDVYNANPDSMKAALDVLQNSGRNRRKIAILGDMLEMGEWAEKAHYDIGKFATESSIDMLLCVGEYANYYVNGAVSQGMSKDKAKIFKTNKEVIQFLSLITQERDIILIKGSRGIKMEEIVTFLQERG